MERAKRRPQVLAAMGPAVSDAVRLPLTRLRTTRALPLAPLVPDAAAIAVMQGGASPATCRTSRMSKAISMTRMRMIERTHRFKRDRGREARAPNGVARE